MHSALFKTSRVFNTAMKNAYLYILFSGAVCRVLASVYCVQQDLIMLSGMSYLFIAYAYELIKGLLPRFKPCEIEGKNLQNCDKIKKVVVAFVS